MGNQEIAEVLVNIARLLELKGENPFKLRAYLNAARAIETYPGDIRGAIESGSIQGLDGVGKALAEKITELVLTGRLKYYEALREEFPPDILTLFDVQGLGGKKIKVLYDSLGVHSLTSLERACLDGSVAALPGFGEKTASNLLKAIDHLRRHAGQFLLDQATPVAEALLDDLRSHPATDLVEVAGSFRRRKPVVRDLDFIVSTSRPAELIESFASHPLLENILAKGTTKASAIAKGGIQCDLRAVTNSEFPFALAYFTGSKEHNIRMRARANDRGWTLNEYRLSPTNPRASAPPPIFTEAELFAALGLEFIPPELREDLGEFDAAESGQLPQLIEWQNLRGTFHNHTNASDGRATLEHMAQAARDLGLEYLGIADHSKSSVIANGLDEKRLLDQIQAIHRLNYEFNGEFRIFAGTECDIRKDGSLDFDDDILAQLDYVVASVHSAFTLGEAEMTHRIIRAIENPYVTMLGHITGRILLSREPYALNVHAVIEAAAETGTIIELNANPRRLELDWTWWPLAKSRGVRCSINPDAHSTAGLGHLIFGVGIARKGWLTRNDVINTLNLREVEAVLSAKRKK